MKEAIVKLFLDQDVLIRTRSSNRPFRATIIDIDGNCAILKHNNNKSALMLSEIVSIQETRHPESFHEVD